MADKKPPDKKLPDVDIEATSSAIPRDLAGGTDSQATAMPATATVPQEDFNATQMAIDIAALNLDATRADMRLNLPSDAEILSNRLEEKKSPLQRFFSAVVGKGPTMRRGGADAVPDVLKPWLYTWVCDPQAGRWSKLVFYLHRLLLVAAGVYLHYVLIRFTMQGIRSEHPAGMFFGGVLGGEFLLLVLCLITRAGPGWLLALPLAGLALIMAFGAVFYHTADPVYLAFGEHTISSLLNPFMLGILIYTGVVSVFTVARGLVMRAVFALVIVIAVAPLFYNALGGVKLELALFGYGPFLGIPAVGQPVFVLLHGLIPVLMFLHLMMSFRSARDLAVAGGRSFARSFAVLFLCLSVLGLALLQKNRVAHVLNFILPKKLDMGAVEIEVLNQKLKVETKNYAKNQGSDSLSRYRFLLEPTKEPGVFLFQTVDEFGFPVRNLSKDDLAIMADDQKVPFEFTEHRDAVAIKKYTKDRQIKFFNIGVYLLKVKMEEKEPLVKWSQIKDQLEPSDKITFTIGDLKKVRSLRIKVKEETVLDMSDLDEETVVLPLSYFDAGEYKLNLSLADESGLKVLEKEIPIRIKPQSSVALLKPVEGDVIGPTLGVVLMPKNVLPKDIAGVSYEIDGEPLADSPEFETFRALPLGVLPEGPHELVVKVRLQSGEQTRKVKFRHQGTVPDLAITSPTLGIFAARDTRVSYRLEGAALSETIGGVKVFVNGEPFEELKIELAGFDLPLSRWSQSEIYVTVQATLKSGARVSDWVLLNKGLGALGLSFDKPSLSFLGDMKIAVVLDASVSGWDNWLGNSKWKTIKNIMGESAIEAIIEDMDPAFVVFGSKKPSYLNDCSDAKLLLKHGKYDKSELARLLTGIKPKGVSALAAALEKAYEESPAKIFVFADGADSCKKSLTKSLAKELAKSPTTKVVIFTLGMVAEEAKTALSDLAEATGGRIYQPGAVDVLIKSWIDEMVLNYQLYSGETMIYQGPLENKRFDLVPGKYLVRMPIAGKPKEIGEFKVENGFLTKATISGDKTANKINVDEKLQQIGGEVAVGDP